MSNCMETIVAVCRRPGCGESFETKQDMESGYREQEFCSCGCEEEYFWTEEENAPNPDPCHQCGGDCDECSIFIIRAFGLGTH